jgi:hypothetical protein
MGCSATAGLVRLAGGLSACLTGKLTGGRSDAALGGEFMAVAGVFIALTAILLIAISGTSTLYSAI